MTGPEAPPRVILADDHGMIREGLRMILESHGVEVVGEAADGAAAVGNAAALRPDVVLMDLRMPGLDGVAATREIVAAGHADVLVLTSFDEDELVLGAIRAGAAGFLLKTTEAGPLVEAVRRVARGEGVLDPRVTRRALAAVAAQPGGGAGPEGDAETREGAGSGRGFAGFSELTAREREVLDALCEGRSNARIAARLGISIPTVKTHVSSILVKLGAESRTHAVALARSARPR
ncbi:response regulator transcription factor [Leucobacter sp. CSA1]|uniref:Response regulator transcription factor n=1 Tax=Leucobacter chromiisoli TaxID=2796471 RepID=A0A934UVA4_9MICO|nr:response regulator transcription factor [Leucobacter chromiisoli]MBK0419705.1 response regulator transcription factor [Leucobacter chromiisoli]